MTLTLLALFGLPLCLKMVLDPEGMTKILKEWEKSGALQFISAMGPLMLALLIFTTSKVQFSWNWDSLLSWIGIIIALKGLAHLAPKLVSWKMSFLKEERLPMFGFFGLLILLAMVYIDTQLIK